MSEHMKAMLRKGKIDQRPPREAMQHAEQAVAQEDSIRCPNCSNTIGISPEGDTNDTWTLPADPIIDGPLDMEENNGQVQICLYCGYDLTDIIQGFYGES